MGAFNISSFLMSIFFTYPLISQGAFVAFGGSFGAIDSGLAFFTLYSQNTSSRYLFSMFLGGEQGLFCFWVGLGWGWFLHY